jgi:hypothetical protein
MSTYNYTKPKSENQQKKHKGQFKRKLNLYMAILADPGLSDGAKAVAGVLLFWFHNTTSGQCYPENFTVGYLIGMDPSNVSRRITELVDAGYVIRESRYNSSSITDFAWDRGKVVKELRDQLKEAKKDRKTAIKSRQEIKKKGMKSRMKTKGGHDGSINTRYDGSINTGHDGSLKGVCRQHQGDMTVASRGHDGSINLGHVASVKLTLESEHLNITRETNSGNEPAEFRSLTSLGISCKGRQEDYPTDDSTVPALVDNKNGRLTCVDSPPIHPGSNPSSAVDSNNHSTRLIESQSATGHDGNSHTSVNQNPLAVPYSATTPDFDIDDLFLAQLNPPEEDSPSSSFTLSHDYREISDPLEVALSIVEDMSQIVSALDNTPVADLAKVVEIARGFLDSGKPVQLVSLMSQKQTEEGRKNFCEGVFTKHTNESGPVWNLQYYLFTIKKLEPTSPQAYLAYRLWQKQGEPYPEPKEVIYPYFLMAEKLLITFQRQLSDLPSRIEKAEIDFENNQTSMDYQKNSPSVADDELDKMFPRLYQRSRF